jgi:hypothetical protein
MKDSDIDKANELRYKRDKSNKCANEVYNRSVTGATQAYQFAFDSLDQTELTQVRDILVNACHREAEKYAAELQKL